MRLLPPPSSLARRTPERAHPRSRWGLGAAALLLASTFSPSPLRAELYQAADLSEVRQEEDLRDLVFQGDLADDDLEILLELLLSPIDVNRAGRDQLYQLPSLTYSIVDALIEYREKNGRFERLDQLLAVEGMTPEILAQIAPFSIARPALKDRVKAKGSVKSRVAYTRGDTPIEGAEGLRDNNQDVLRLEGYEPIPEAYVRVRAEVNDDIQTGLVLLEQADVAGWAYNPNELDFNLSWGQPVFSVQKAYVMLTRERWDAVFGNYAVGFGQRLVFDDTQRNRPNGFYADDRVNNSVGFSAPQREFGVAGTFKGGRLGEAVLSGTAWASFRRYDLFQNRFATLPPDGVIYGDLAYGLSPHGLLPSGAQLPYVTYPNLYSEALVGVHGDVVLRGFTRLGVTAYGARIVKNAPVYFTNATPDRPTFGALGVDFSTRYRKINAAGELAVMDSGGVGALVRGARGLNKGEVVLSLRHYGTDFDNPHSRGQAQADVYTVSRPDSRSPDDDPFDPELYTSYDRDRDEQGARLEGYSKLKPSLRLTGYFDVWRAPSTGLWDLDTQARADYTIRKKLSWDLLLRYQDKILSQYGRAYSFSSDVICDPDDPEAQCAGEIIEEDPTAAGAKITAATFLTLHQVPFATFYINYRRTYEDDRRAYILSDCETEVYTFRVGQVASLKGTAELPHGMRAAARLRYLDDDVYGNKGLRELGAYAQLEWWDPAARFKISGRYTVDSELWDPGDKDYIRCSNGGELPVEREDWTADQRQRTPEQTVLATFEYRF